MSEGYESVEIAIVGAGPAGISMAAEAIRAGIPTERVVIIEKGIEHSWAIRKYYPANKPVTANYKGNVAVCHGVLCISDTNKDGYLTYIDDSIVRHALDVRYGVTVFAIHALDGGGFELETTAGTVRSAVCVIAIGILGKPNKPPYRLPRKLKERLHFDITSYPIVDSRVLIVGGGDSASEYVQYLVEVGNRVALSYRRDDFFRMNEINRDSLLALERLGRAEILRSSNVTGVEIGDHGGPQVVFEEERYGSLPYDHVVFALGGTTPENFLKTIGIEFDGPRVKSLDGYETNVEGLFLVGDLSAGKKGGSIISAFNSSHHAMRRICLKHLACG